MKTIDIYSTTQCGFCQTLKSQLDSKKIVYISHDVATDEKELLEMQKLSKGAMTVPVTVVGKGTKDQKVLVGYSDSLKALNIEEGLKKDFEKSDTATLTCPQCGHKQKGKIPTTSCVPFYVCKGCKKTIKAEGEDCCVFCSYADKQCPLKKSNL